MCTSKDYHRCLFSYFFKLFPMECQLPSRCLICYRSKSNDMSREDCSFGGELFSNTIHVVFVLRNLLGIPKEEVFSYLHRVGGSHPVHKWIWTCSSCTELIGEARELHKETVQSTQKLEKVKNRIVERVKDSAKPKGGRRTKRKPVEVSVANLITNESRSFVLTHNYKVVISNPFLEGDMRARKLAMSMINTNVIHDASNSIVIKEDQRDDKVTDDSDPEWNLDLSDPDKKSKPIVALKLRVTGDQGRRMEVRAGPKVNGQERKHPCSFCGKKFKQSGKRRRHEEIHLNKGRLSYQCDQCGKSFATRYYLSRHIRRHQNKTTDPRYHCSQCDKKFHYKSEMVRHEARHAPKTKYMCHVCRQVFEVRGGLKRHLMSKHKVSEEEALALAHCNTSTKFQCSYCPKYFFDRTSFSRHERVHTNAETKPFQCEVCGKEFALPLYLKNHMESHVQKDEGHE